ncbi:MAG: hypothetical protein PVH18_09585 [Chloroflexota bacterium]|jgi:hypothetical protein
MYRFLKYLIPAAVLVLAVAAVTVTVLALNGPVANSQAEVADPLAADAVIPDEIHYQGYLLDDQGDPVDGPVDLQFDLYEDAVGGISLWSQTETDVDVDQGYFSLQLGPLTVEDLRLPQSASTLYIQVSILPDGGGQVALPRQPLASAPYAFLSMEAASAPWDGLTGVPPGFADGIDDVEFQNVVTVAKSGGQYTSIQTAIDEITDAGEFNRYLVWIGPGYYQGQVQTKPFVSLVGAGQWLTWIESEESNPDVYPPAQATLHLTNNVNVRDLTVANYGADYRSVAILSPNGVQGTILDNVSALASGSGDINYGLFVDGGETNVDLRDVSSYCFGPSLACVALEVANGAYVRVRDGQYNAFGGQTAVAIAGTEAPTRLELFDVDAEAADAQNSAIGLRLWNGAEASAHGGRFDARNAITETFGISVEGGAALEATGANAYGHDSSNYNHGLRVNGAWTLLNGGSFSGWGGLEAFGILNTADGTLEANNVKASAESATERNDGVRNEGGADSMFNGGFFVGRGGGDNRGMANYDAGSFLDVQHGEIQGEGENGFGVSNEFDGSAFITLSELAGNTNSVLADGATTRVHLSRLAGGATGGSGELFCVAITYELGFYAESCP